MQRRNRLQQASKYTLFFFCSNSVEHALAFEKLQEDILILHFGA